MTRKRTPRRDPLAALLKRHPGRWLFRRNMLTDLPFTVVDASDCMVCVCHTRASARAIAALGRKK